MSAVALTRAIGFFLLTIEGKIIKFATNLIARSVLNPGPGLRARNQTRRRKRMIEVTPSATQQVAEYFKGKEVTPIRIFLNSGG